MPLTIGQEEEQKAIIYRNQWDARIAYRANQLRMLSGPPNEFERIWQNYRHVYDPTNYIQANEEYTEFFTPFDIDDSGGISKSEVKLRGAKQSRRKEPTT